ncbi:MAG: hypothetical protein CSB33_02025 [Desulfobacterales bacterium]|nr:MAG: hypothetical protein CSB33_02025 [Desulfobacterales bacterium]
MTKDGMTGLLVRNARERGADAVEVIPAVKVPVAPELRGYCRTCPAHGAGASCPPHVMDVAAFARSLDRYDHAVIFRLDVALEILQTDAHLVYSERIYRIASVLSREALRHGAGMVQALGAGSCRRIFCAAESGCPVVEKTGPCRRPGLAAPSISAMGIHVFRLAEYLGWPMRKITAPDAASGISSAPEEPAEKGMLVGMVLV